MLRRLLSPARLLTVGLILLAAVVVALLTIKSDDFLAVPDPAHPLARLVQVSGAEERPDGGGIYYVDVVVKRASLLESTFDQFRPEGADVISKDSFVPRGLTYSQALKLERDTMKVSQAKAAVVALRALGYNVRARTRGVRVVDVDSRSHAHGVLKDDDVVVSADGRPVKTRLDLYRALQGHKVGDVVRLGVRRGNEQRSLSIRTVADATNPRRAIVGFIPSEVVDVHLPLRIRFNLGDVGGPSAGLAFALQVLEERGRDIDHGLKVAATGEIQLDGSVTRIGGVKQKTIGARKAHVDAFLVPADGDNAKVAKRYAHGLRIIPVKSFQQALQSLATLNGKA